MKRKIVRTLIAILSVMVFVVFLPIVDIIAHYNDRATTPADCAVIFGAAVWRDDIPSQALYDRTMSAAQLYHDGLVKCLVLSGGASTYGAHEVAVMQDLLIADHVPQDVFILDPHGKNTTTTLNNLDKTKSYIFVSNDFHLARIALLAYRADIAHFALHKATYYNGRYKKEPYFLLREIGGLLYYFFGLNQLQHFYYTHFT